MTSTSAAPGVTSTMIVPTVYGQMLVNRYDMNQTNALVKTGHAPDHPEIVLLTDVLEQLGTDLTVLDVGAMFGTYSLAMSSVVGPNGRIHAFEPQRLIYNLMVGSVALNGITNVICHNVAIGETVGQVEIPQFDYNRPMNFGSIEFGTEQTEPVAQTRSHDSARIEHVPIVSIDQLDFPSVHLMKVDVEGMEIHVLNGSARPSAVAGRCSTSNTSNPIERPCGRRS